MKNLVSIQYIRAIAALGVVIFHFGFTINRPNFFIVGKAGVDLFFIISGFIMYVTTESRNSNPISFFLRRIARIVPLYWMVTIGMVAIVIVHPKFGGEFSADISFKHVISSLLFFPRTNSFGDDYPTVRPGWTLNIEMFFYLVMVLILFFQRRSQPWVITIILGSLVIFGLLRHSHYIVINTYTNVLLLEFAVESAWLRFGREVDSHHTM